MDATQIFYATDNAFTKSFRSASEITDAEVKEYFSEWINNNRKPNSTFSDYHSTPDYCFVDGAVYDEESNTLYVFELKKRKVDSSTYDSAIIKQKKFNNMMQSAMSLRSQVFCNIKLILVSIYTNGVMYLWNINDYFTQSTKAIKKVEEFHINNNPYIETPVFEYKFNDGVRVEDEKIKEIF